MRKPKQLEFDRKYVRVDRAENRGVNVEFNAVLKNDIYRNPSNKTLFRRGALPKKEAKFGIFWCNPEVHYQWKNPPIRQAYLLPPDQRFRLKLHFMEQQNPSIPPRPAPTVAPAAAAVSPAAATVPPAAACSRPASPASPAAACARAAVPDPDPAAARARSRAPSAAVPAASRSRSAAPAAARSRSAAPAAARARSAVPAAPRARSASLGHAPVQNTPAPAPDRSRAPAPPRAPAAALAPAVPDRVVFDPSKTRYLLPFLSSEYPNLDRPARTEQYIQDSYNRHLADQTVLDQEHCLEMMLSCHYKFQMEYLLIDMRHRAEEFALREKCPCRRSPKYAGRFEMAADDVRTLIRDILGSSFHPCIFTKRSRGDRLFYQVMFYVNSSMQPVRCVGTRIDHHGHCFLLEPCSHHQPDRSHLFQLCRLRNRTACVHKISYCCPNWRACAHKIPKFG